MLNGSTLCKTLFTHIPSAVVVLDQQKTITDCNPAFQQLVSAQLAEIVGKPIDQVLLLLQPNSKTMSTAWSTIPTADWCNDQKAKLPNGNVIPIAYQVIAIEEDDTEPVMVLIKDARREQELMELRSEFVSIVSHQLRTPASAVKWYMETLIDNRRGNTLNEWQVDKMHQAYQSNERMISLINDLLNASRLDSGKFQLHLTSFNLGKMVEEVKGELIHFARAHNVDINNHIPADLPQASADLDKVREVILNLTTNAIKYSPAGHREVNVNAVVKGKMIECSVQDQGIGIPEKGQAHLFEKFYRADNAIESQTEGSGLGLYIAREIIRLHGGDIWFTSKENVGTTIYFNIPIYGN
ncbi:MAG: PAS domain-containing protein [Candidatus Kerfeldbacteria bacterium]|nr:PAS domain-containing protein [Candidatus Kerfeldbacteria bacterium]